MSSFVSDLPPLADGVSRDYLLWHRLCPMGRTADGRLLVAAAPGASLDGLDELAIAYGVDVEHVEASQGELESLIERLTAGAGAQLELDGVREGDDLEADVRDLA